MIRILSTFFLAFIGISLLGANIHINSTTTYVIFSGAPYNQLKPGDTLFVDAGTYDHLGFKDILATADKPMVILNFGGQVNITGTFYYGLSFANCKHFILSGTGTPGVEYGFNVGKTNGGAVGSNDLSSNFSIDHIEVTSFIGPGMLIKSDPDCNFKTTRDKYVLANVTIHHNYIHDTDTEGIYFGSTFYDGVTLNCNGKDTLVSPHLCTNISIYDNRVENTGWDGIQVASSENFEIHNNRISHDSQKQTRFQMNGIMIGKGSSGRVYNNLITNGSGAGIIFFGKGPLEVFNNVIQDPGTNTTMVDGNYGIYIDAVNSSTVAQGIKIFNNLVVGVKLEGIKHLGDANSVRKDTVANNIVVNNLRVPYPNKLININTGEAVGIKNYTPEDYSSLRYCSADFSSETSCQPSLYTNAGIDISLLREMGDFNGHQRMIGTIDAGPFEYQGTDAYLPDVEPDNYYIYPNPGTNYLTLGVTPKTGATIQINLEAFDSKGSLYWNMAYELNDSHTTQTIPTEDWKSGQYMVKLTSGGKTVVRKFIKQ